MSSCFLCLVFFIYWFSPTRPCTSLPLAFLSVCYVVDVVEPRIVFVDFLCTGACYYFFYQSSCYCFVTRCIYLAPRQEVGVSCSQVLCFRLEDSRWPLGGKRRFFLLQLCCPCGAMCRWPLVRSALS